SIANHHAFGYSPNLETVEFGDNALENIGERSFDNCRALKSIEVPGSVTNIGSYAFYGCTNLVAATLNEGLLTINNNAFENCSSLLVASVPNSVTNLGSSAYASCYALTNITLRGGWNPTQRGRFSSGAENLDTIEIIGNGDLVIGEKTFGDHYNSSVLKERHLKISGVKIIANDYAFGCSPNLETVELSDNALENIGNYSFYNCQTLRSIEVPSSVTNIGSYAFYGCANLATAVLMPTNAPMLGGSAFGNTKPVTVFVSEDAAGYDVAPWSNWNIRKTNADGSIGMSGSLTANATIDAYTPYAIMAPLTVKSGVKLTIESGARVKFYEWSSITVERGGEVAVKGTIDSPISLVPSGDGVEWNGFTVNWGGRLQLEYVNIEGAGSQAKGAVKSDGYASLWGCCISGSDGIALDGGSVYATNTVIKSMGTAVANSAKLVNGVIEDCDVVNADGNVYNTIIKDCGAVTSGNFSYCLFDNTDYANFNHYWNTSIAGDAKFVDGTFYQIAADSPAVD
ncbi:MAG: leucine-rich repeat domain-containing protein, partial [Victivallales bacterium]|nr:leucine-rich repeat domain-containing protein [Victivallales bacterium]